MKKIIFVMLALTAIGSSVLAQNLNIPDANFKAYLVGNTLINANLDGEIQISEANAYTGTINCPFSSISDLTGIEEFTNLTELNCYNNNLTTLNVSQNTHLLALRCGDNNLGNIDVSQNLALTLFMIQNANLTTLDVTNNTALETLYCHVNNLSTINLTLNTALKDLAVRSNNLTNLNISQNTNLESLYCFNNNLNSLDISQNILLEELYCQNNSLTLLNMNNISTSILTNFNATNNPNLICIEVDNTSAAASTWTNIDATASFSLDCNYSLSVNEYESSQKILIYPNPVKSEIHINTLEKITSVKILNTIGETTKTNINSNNTIDTSNLSNGVYTLQLLTKEGMFNKKFIKE